MGTRQTIARAVTWLLTHPIGNIMAQQERPYGAATALGVYVRLASFAVPFLIAFEVWQTQQLQRMLEEQATNREWRSTVPNRMQTEAEKLRLEILSTVNGTVGVTLVEIQKGQIRLEMALEDLKRRITENTHATLSKE